MKRIVVLAILMIMIPSCIWADLGIPDVHAICRIEMEDGRAIEGVLLVGIGGWQEYLDTSGFLVISKKLEEYNENDPFTLKLGLDRTGWPPVANMQAELFSDEFYAYMPNDGRSFKYPPGSGARRSSGGWARRDQKIYYVQDVTSQKYQVNHRGEAIEAYGADSCVVIKKAVTRHVEYRLIQYIPVYPRIPPSLFIHHGDPGFVKVAVDSVVSFEFVLEPSQEWLDRIDAARREWSEDQDTFEVLFPVWMHEVFKDRERYGNIRFKPWRF